MNALELADLLIKPSSTHGAFCYEAATMLRQQQAEIEALKTKLQILLEAQDYSAKLQIKYISEIEALQKDLDKYDRLAWDDLKRNNNE